MSKYQDTPVRDLSLDLRNYRTRPQPDEEAELQALISVNPERFWSLTNSLLDSGYLPTENIIVLRSPNDPLYLVVREGNRRVGALKIILGLVDAKAAGVDVPEDIRVAIKKKAKAWKDENESVPCTIYDASESATVDRIVALVHGKGEKAARAPWSAVAKARLSRDRGGREPALDLLEHFLDAAKNITTHQREAWSGDFPLSVLDDVMKRTATRFGAKNAPDLANRYPQVSHRTALDAIIRDIGIGTLDFKKVRSDKDFAAEYGVPKATTQSKKSTPPKTKKRATKKGKGGSSPSPAMATNDPAGVKRTLRGFKPLGNNREKVVALLKEARALDMRKTPLAFCFVLRSMFEISAKACCQDHGIKTKRSDGKDRNVVDMLRDATNHLTGSGTKAANMSMTRALHGAMADLAKPDGLLSVTSMN